ncbi:MAG: ABC transporter permease, partial [Actinomycetota bacterium]|nr:ABC transporter permease [Actinomycetota bacterium]
HEPAADDEVLLSESTAATLLVGPGSRLSLTSSTPTTVRVAGIYSSGAGTDPLVFGPDRLLESRGVGAATSLPILATKSGFSAITQSIGQTDGLHVEWDAEPDLRGATLGDLRRLAGEANGIPPAIRAAVGGASVSADLGSLVPGAERAVTDSLAPMFLVAVEVAMVGLFVLMGVGSLKLARQSFELAVLKTRGARMRLLLAVGSAEAALSAAMGFPLALAVGLGLAVLARAAHGPGSPGAPFRIALDERAALVGLAGVGIGTVALVLTSLPQLRRSVLQERREASRERRPGWLRLPSEAVPLALGALALTELRRRGIQPSGGRLDPLVLVGPTLLILGGGILAVRALFWGFRRAEPLADRLRSPSSYIAFHHLPRASANMSLALLLVLSTGLFAFSSSLRTTVLRGNENVARGQVGADWNFLVGTPTQGAAVAGALPPGTTLVFHGSVATTSEPRLAEGTMIGLDPSNYASGGWWRGEDADLPLSTLLSRLTPAAIGVALPSGIASVQLRTDPPIPAGVKVVASLEDPGGRVAAQELVAERPGSDTYAGLTGQADRLLSVVLTAEQPSGVPQRRGGFDVTFEGLSLLGSFSDRIVPLSTWRGLDTGGQTVATSPVGSDGIRARFAAVPGGPIGGIAPTDPPVPALVGVSSTGAALTAADVRVGYLQVSARVVGTIRAFPGIRRDTPLLVVPVRAVAERFAQILQVPNGGAFSVLAMGPHDPTQGVRSTGVQVLGVSRAASIEALLGSSPQNLALGMEFAAGVAGALLAALALGLALYFGGRRRRYEFSSLRALGGRPGHAAVALAVEYGLLLVPALAVGFGVGTALLALVLSNVVPSVAAGVPKLLVDRNAVLAAVVASAVTLAIGLLVTARGMRTVSASAVLRGEAE